MLGMWYVSNVWLHLFILSLFSFVFYSRCFYNHVTRIRYPLSKMKLNEYAIKYATHWTRKILMYTIHKHTAIMIWLLVRKAQPQWRTKNVEISFDEEEYCATCIVRHPTWIGTYSLAWGSRNSHCAFFQVQLPVQWLSNHLLPAVHLESQIKELGILSKSCSLKLKLVRYIQKCGKCSQITHCK